MKKILLTLSMAITMSSAWAAKAINKPITIQQSDGTLITVYLHGDEDFHWYTSADGTACTQGTVNCQIGDIKDSKSNINAYGGNSPDQPLGNSSRHGI